jgi:hypothetical protein
MSGAPQVRLILAGATLGAPATPAAKPAHAVTLAPGAAATSMLTDYSTCNASNSDTVRITPPGQAKSVDAPLMLRGCKLEVSPVTPAG